ncbi:TetR/AcrR family transcriptional regulator [Achromobacter xylosoxidans]|uniref:TetR/AcrR family transcriptional regulator n=1 Tax=Alcaligenes xylosoxydans xylosoxydans TaxID=85698 RepID=UPI001F144A9C|nr:TetR/AcrR family transcriptional regulator [Achromobacter xylosoxidans]
MSDEVAKPVGRPSARKKILDTALEIIAESGLGTLTLDAVAERAGISKGGLLYHFRLKEQLIRAANEHLVQRRIAACEHVASGLPDTKSRELKAYVIACVNNSSGNDLMSKRIFAAGSLSEESGEPIRQHFKRRFPQFADAVGFDRAALAHVATEGLWFMEMFGVSPFNEAQRKQLISKILEIVDGTDGQH